jgi:hypothetical protein
MNRGNIIFLILSLITIVIGTSIFIEASAYQKKAKVTEGIVTSRDITYFYVKYISDDGVERTHQGTQSKNKKYYVGDKFKVFYLKDNPDKSRIHDGKKGGKTTIIIGIIMLLFDLYLINQNKSRNKSAIKFRTSGRKVQAEITSIEPDMNTTVLEKHPYIINCRWVDPMTGKEYTDTIKQIWKDPAPLLAGRSHIDVYIDRDDPDKYFLDVEFLSGIKPY